MVVDPEINVNQAVARGNDLPPRNLRILRAHRLRNVAGRLADQLEIAHGGIVIQPAGYERSLVETIGIGDHLLGADYHVIKVNRHSRDAASDMDRLALGKQINRV